MIQIIKHILILQKDNLSKYKMQIKKEKKILREKKRSKPAWPCVKR